MSDNENKELVAYRMQKAIETIAEVDILIENKIWNTAINRMYYACYYAASALLATIEVYPKSHSGTQQMFNLHFVKTGLVDNTYSSFYSKLMDMKQGADYEDFVDYNEDDVFTMLSPAQNFISMVKAMLDEAK